MYYKTTAVSPNRTPQAVMLRKTSNALPTSTYFTSIKATPIKSSEQRFEPTEGCRLQSQYTPERTIKKQSDIEIQILRNELSIKEQEINNLQKQLDASNDDRNKLRCALEQKTIQCANKEREIVKLLATIHQLEIKKQDSTQDLSKQIEEIKQLLKQDNVIHKIQHLENENDNLHQELDHMQKYIREVVLQNKDFQQKYQDKCLELQRREIDEDQFQMIKNQLKCKEEENQILKQELQSHTQQLNSIEQQNQIQEFLQQIKKQYFEESSRKNMESDCASIDQSEFKQDFDYEQQIKQPVYSFQTKTDD